MTDGDDTVTGDGGPARRPRRGVGSRGGTASRRRGPSGAELVESLRQSIDQLIAENRALRRQLARTTGAAGAGAERTLREIQRRVLQAVSPARSTVRSRAGTRRRQAGGVPPAPRRRPRGKGEDAG